MSSSDLRQPAISVASGEPGADHHDALRAGFGQPPVDRAQLLADELNRRDTGWAHVNLIPLNPTPGSEWDAAPQDRQDEFVRRVQAQGVPCTVRDTKGDEIAAACGQLAADEREDKSA